jgi:dihydrodipicolinate synthase/N-acetylneuraminate lyase
MNLRHIHGRRHFGRSIIGMAAVLVPFTDTDAIDEDAYVACLREIIDAGLIPAVNMDTGYVHLLTPDEKTRILHLASQTLQGAPFVAGAFIEGQDGEIVDLYQREIAQIVIHGGTPLLFQTARLHNVPSSVIVDTYARAVAGVDTAYAFELGKMFAANGDIWPKNVVQGIMEIPQIKGMKHSSLDRVLEIDRLALRDRIRPEFRIFTGNDLGIDMVEYGSDYLLGLAAFAPAKFAERDRLWQTQDTGYLAVSDSLQHLGNTAFRPPIAAYKHSAAIFLHLLGKIPTDRTHPNAPRRPAWERDLMKSCAARLGLA